MQKSAWLIPLLILTTLNCAAQDSVWVRLRPKYDKAGKVHRFFFGENYRREWADSTYLPVIDLAKVQGGLTPEKLGGGHQTVYISIF